MLWFLTKSGSAVNICPCSHCSISAEKDPAFHTPGAVWDWGQGDTRLHNNKAEPVRQPAELISPVSIQTAQEDRAVSRFV